jgi:glutamate N-acetyltransferase/amino-acid N-acetyltransferase
MRGGRFRWDIELGTPGRYVLLASDLSYDYVKINADYRS